MTNFLRISIIVGLCAIAYSCATPSSPTGGPRDEKGPEIIRTEPETGTTNFDEKEIVLHFSEFVDRGSLSEALIIEPQLGLVYDIDWGRKSVAIQFEESLPDSTTMIVTVGTEFTDVNNNKLASPYKVAVSTGSTIDEGKLTGRVRDARTGNGNEGRRVLLYRTPVDLTLPASYIGESDTSGTVNFSYLSAGRYKAFWVDDRNRNRLWDPEQERAQPFKEEFITLQKSGEDTLGTLYVAGSDTAKPKLQGVGMFSSQRLRLRFSENIVLTDSSRLRVQDSLGTAVGKAYPLYISPEEGYVMLAQNTQALAADSSYRLLARNFADAAGNVQPVSEQSFTGSAQEDTTAQRIVGTSVGKGIFPNESIRIAYAKPIGSASIRDSLKVIEGNEMRDEWQNLQIQQNEFRILPDSSWQKGVEYEFRTWNPIIQDYNSITPTIWHPSDQGAINIVFADSTSEATTGVTQLLLKNPQNRVISDTTFTGSITLQNLAPVNHQLTLYRDLNGNGAWDAGSVSPFKAPEPYYIRNDVPVQSGFTADLTVRFSER